MPNIKAALYTAKQSNLLDDIAINKAKIRSYTLMQRAGRAVFQQVIDYYPEQKHIAIFCGKGNNGGDGCVVAKLAHQFGYTVTLYGLCEIDALKSDAKTAAQDALDAGVVFRLIDENHQLPSETTLIIDALLGTGISGEVDGIFKSCIQTINNSPCPVIAIDIPSGLNADTGHTCGCAIKADITVTFICIKQGLLLHKNNPHVGLLQFDDLSIPAHVYEQVPANIHILNLDTLKKVLTPRKPESYKGDFGHVLIIAGAQGMAGAALLAAMAALKAGAGLVSLATHPDHAHTLTLNRPEIMTHGIKTPESLQPLLEKASILVLGPGMTQSRWSDALFKMAFKTTLPKIVDAGALDYIKAHGITRQDWILTPHPGEAARLLGCETHEIQLDRVQAVNTLQNTYEGVIVLKGSQTLVCTQFQTNYLCPYGNPGMATGGTGDVLAGFLGGLAAQHYNLALTAQLGICLHAVAGDRATKAFGERSVLAKDILNTLRIK